MRTFQNLFVSNGLNAFSLLYTLHANLWTVVDGVANVVRLTEGRYINRRNRIKELKGADPLAELKDLFNYTTGNLVDFTRLVRDLACEPVGDIDAIPTECLELEDYDDVLDEDFDEFPPNEFVNRIDTTSSSVQMSEDKRTETKSQAIETTSTRNKVAGHRPAATKLEGHRPAPQVLPESTTHQRFNASFQANQPKETGRNQPIQDSLPPQMGPSARPRHLRLPIRAVSLQDRHR